MRKFLKIAAATVVSLVAAAVGAVFVLANSDWGHEQLRTRAESALNGAAHGIVKIGRIDGNLLRGITIKDVSITDSSGAPFVKAGEIYTGYSIRPFISRKIELSNVRMSNADIVIDRKSGEFWNYERIFPTDSLSPATDTAGIQFGDWVVLHEVEVTNSNLTVRLPWSPPDSVSARVRDSVIKAALDSTSRTKVVAVEGGYQRVQEFRDINGKLPLARIAHPDFKTRAFDVDSLRMVALAFAPPAAIVRQLKGKFEVDADSVWFTAPEVKLPNSDLEVVGRYSLESGDMALHVLAKALSTSDARFLYPALPDTGSARFDLALSWVGDKQQYLVRQLDLKLGEATAKGDFGITLDDTLQLHQTDLVFAGVSTALIEQLVPGIDVPRKGVLEGRAKIDGPFNAMQVDGDVKFNDTRSGMSRVMAVGELGTENGVFRARNLRVTLTPVQMDLIRIALDDFPIGGTVSGDAILNGATNTRLVASRFALTHVENGERSVLAGRGAIRLGDIPYLSLDATAKPVSLVTVGKYAPAAELRGALTGSIKLEGTTRDLFVNSTMTSSDGGTIAAVGRLDVASKEIGYNVNLTSVLFNANELTEKAPKMSLSAVLAARGRGFEPETMQSDLAASVSTSTIDTLAVDSSDIVLHIANGMARVDTFAVRVPGARADVNGMFGMSTASTGLLNYRVQVDSVGKLARYLPFDTTVVPFRPGPVADRLAALRDDSARVAQKLAVARAAGVAVAATPVVIDTPPALRRDSLAGSALLQGTLKGSISAFDLEGTLRASGIVAMGNTVQNARANYKWIRALTDSSVAEVSAIADSVSAAGFLLDSVNARGTYQKPGGSARVSVFQNSQRDYGLNANYAIYPDRKELRFEDLRFRFDSTRWVSSRPGSVLWGQPGVEVENIELRNGKGGRIFADGKLPTEGTSNLTVQVANFEVGDLMGLLQSDLAIKGLLSVDAKVAGANTAPQITGSASVANATYGGTAVPEVRTQFNYDQQRLVAQADATYDGRSIATARGTVPVNLATSGVTGSRLLDAPSSIELKADSLPLDLVSKFTDVVTETKGFAVGTAALNGPIREPKLTGDLRLGNSEMRITELGVKLVAMNGSLHIRNDSLVLDSLSARSGGRLSITGGMGIAKIAEPSFDLRISADKARVLDNEQGKAVADATIEVTGPFDAVVVSGKARIREGVFYIPKSDTREQISAGDSVIFAGSDSSSFDNIVGRPSPLINNLRMDLSLAVDRDTWVRSTEANVEVFSDGDLRINIDRRRGTLTLDGVVSTDRGEYEFMSKRFQLKRGSATFIGTQAINPLLQFTGEYEVKQATQQAIKIRILIGGTMLSPRLTLESDAQPPITQSDLLSYLAFGNESGSLLQFGGSSVSGSSAGGGLVGTSAALATKQLAGVVLGIAVDELEGTGARSLGADVFNITPANIPTELASGQYGAFETFLRGTQIEYGKYFSTSTFVGLQLQAPTPGFRVEHRFGNRGLSLESTFQPRFFLSEPSLAPQDLIKTNSFGLFLVRRWKF